MKVCLQDIADKANVSPATVSNALHNRSGVSSQVAQRIISIAAEMGYKLTNENTDTRRKYIRLVVYKSHGLVIMDTQFFSELIESIQRKCRELGLELFLTYLRANDTDLLINVKEIRNEVCAGILLLGTEMSQEELHVFFTVQISACRT